MSNYTKNYEIDTTSAKYSLKRYGDWFRSENRGENLGYPSRCAFTSERVDNDGGNPSLNEEGEIQEILLIIEKALVVQPILFKIAINSYVYCFRFTASDKARNLYLHENIQLGTTDNAARQKYKTLEDQLHAYILGILQAQPE